MADNRHPHIAGQGGIHPAPGFSQLQGGMGVGMVPLSQPVFRGAGGLPLHGHQPHTGFFPGMVNTHMMRLPSSPMATNMFPVQQIRPPAGLPPSYSQQLAASYQEKARSPASLQSPRGPPKQKTEKERYFEQQQQRLRQFSKPGAQVVDANKLLENIFGKAENPQTGHRSATCSIGGGAGAQTAVSAGMPCTENEDDGFGDFFGGPSTSSQSPNSNLDAGTPPGIPTGHSSVPRSSQAPAAATPGPEDHKQLPPRETTEKKDLMSMMIQCSDLKAPQKAKGFHKPSLMEVQKAGAGHSGRPAVFHESDHARRWTSTEDLEGLFVVQSHAKAAPVQMPNHAPELLLPPPASPASVTIPASAHPACSAGVVPLDSDVPYPHSPPAGPPPSYSSSLAFSTHPPTPVAALPPPAATDRHPAKGTTKSSRGLPEWCYDSGHNLPVVYNQVFEACSDGDEIVTGRLYSILLLSQLPREQLGQLWNLVNTQTPGQLVRSELWMLLALIALVQNQYPVTSVDILKRCAQAPVPFLAQPSAIASNLPLNSAHCVHASASPLGDIKTQGRADKPEHEPQNSATHGSFSVQSHAAHPVQPPATAGTPAVLPIQTHPQDMDDDFADFQAAPPQPALLSTRTVSSTAPSKTYSNVTTGSRSVDTDRSFPSSTPAAAAEKLETLYVEKQYVHKQRLESVSAEDKYASNVRSFFCSSDSSTAGFRSTRRAARHTTPNSLDEDDFTDGHDSLSQVSTSEQSENEDIRAFENYVEEMRGQREVHSSHEILQKTFPKMVISAAGAGDTGNSNVRGIFKGGGQEGLAVNHEMYPGRNIMPPVIPAVPLVTNRATAPAASSAPVLTSDDEFDDFKSAITPTSKKGDFSQFVTGVPQKGTSQGSSGDMALIGEEDKYGALRELTSNQPSLFEQRSDQNNSSAKLGVQSQQTEEEEEWADFSCPAAPTTSANTEGTIFSGSSDRGFLREGLTSTATEEGGWADFETTKDSSAAEFSYEGPGRAGGSFRSVQFDTDYLPASQQGDDSLSSALQPSSPSPQTHTSGRNANQPPLAGHSSAPVLQRDSDDDWADFAAAKPSSMAREEPSTQNVERAESLQSECSLEHPVLSEGHTSETYVGKDQSAVVTIKKKNLETREILGLFKVRSDPATLSSYELSRPALDRIHFEERSHPTESFRRQRSRSGSKDRRASSDGDDDFAMGPPPMDSIEDYDYDHDYGISRGYDLDDMVHQSVPTTVYRPYGFGSASIRYTSSSMLGTTRTSKGVQESRSHSLSPDSGESDSLSNRVSSLKEDSQSVSSLELPATRMPTDAHRDSDNGGTDSQSVSSMEFGASDRSARGDIAMESKSLDSLDLHSDNVEPDDADDDGKKTATEQGVPPVFSQGPILGDRYNIDGQVAEGSDRYAFEWERCLSSCRRLICDANNILNTISSSAICNEVLRAPQGTDYIIGIVEIYRVVCRIIAALSSIAVSSAVIQRNLKDIDLAWNNLTAFLVGASLLPDETSLNFAHAVLKSDTTAAHQKACGVCLLDVDSQGANGNGDHIAKLSYGGRQYHAPCANFWVNCVDSMLPALRLPDLL